MGKRIFQYPEVTELAEDDYIMIDSEADDTRCILASKIAPTVMSKTVTERKVYNASEDGVKGYSSVDVKVPFTNITDLEGDIVTFDDGENLPLASLKTTIVPIQEGSGDPSPSNVRPIQGWSGANVTVSPLNISQLYNGQIYGDGSWVSNNMRLTNVTEAQDNSYFLKAGTYTLDYDKLNPNAPNLLQCSALTKDGNYTIIDNFANEWNSVPFTFTLTQDGYFYFTIRKDADTNINPSDYRAKILGQTYNIPFTDAQGNPIEVFGGELDCVNGGEQPMTLGKIIVDENTDVKGYGGWRFYFDVPNFVSPASNVVANIKCDKLATKSKNALPSTNSISAYDTGGARMIISVNDTITTVDAIKAWLANNPLEIVYELATPSTFTSQPTSINSLLGSNNVWGDCGKSLVSYQKTWVQPDFTPDNN